MAIRNPQAILTALVASHGTALHRFLLARARNGTDVPDIIQEVYLRMLRIPNIDSIRSPEAYLFTVARHVLQQHTLRQAAVPTSLELEGLLNAGVAADSADPLQEVDAQQCLELLQTALDQMMPKMRAVFILHRRDGLSIAEIAKRLEISQPLVKKYLMKSLIEFRLHLDAAE